MSLRHEPDTQVADWFVDLDADWWTLATQGPAGFEAYATVWFDHGESENYRSDDTIMATVVGIAAQHTRTPEDLIFGLWDGWGELTDGARQYSLVRANWMRDLWFKPTPPRIPPAFPDDVLDGPKADLQANREYLLFRGPAAEVGQWAALPFDRDVERTLPPASLTWPADRAWFISADVDASWLCVGGSEALISALLGDARLDAEPATYGQIPALEFGDR